jgi:uncharacterized membrane protein (UPF0127 family)
VALVNVTTGETVAERVTLCETFWTRGRGLMFRRRLTADEAYVFVGSRESIALTTIHMFFVFFPVAVLWLDHGRKVVDVVRAYPFRPRYAPSKPARYFIEALPSLLEKVRVGEVMDWEADRVVL